MATQRGGVRRKRESAEDEVLVLDRLPAMPSLPSRESRSRPTAARPELGQAATKKRKISDVVADSDDDLFGPRDDLDVVDLADTEEVPAALIQKKPKNEVLLSAFQCVICMDDVANLTVTHCGHLFCSECLHSSLVIDMSKRICPICRQKIDQRPVSGKFGQKAKGYYALELKLTTKKSLGKRTASS